MTAVPIQAAHAWKSNAELIEACAQLGYLAKNADVLDATYGKGTFWKLWQPTVLVKHDLALDGVDFRDLPYADGMFSYVVFDPPYKLNGTPTPEVDARYGVAGGYTSAADRMALILDGARECARVCERYLLVKCQDQVNAGKVVWQTDAVTRVVEVAGFRKLDHLMLLGGRAQPEGRRQLHARRNYSSLLVFVRERTEQETLL